VVITESGSNENAIRHSVAEKRPERPTLRGEVSGFGVLPDASDTPDASLWLHVRVRVRETEADFCPTSQHPIVFMPRFGCAGAGCWLTSFQTLKGLK
jgi:hypothetical protein